jgi:hypothetical protein
MLFLTIWYAVLIAFVIGNEQRSAHLNDLEFIANRPNATSEQILAYEKFLELHRTGGHFKVDRVRSEFLGQQLCALGKTINEGLYQESKFLTQTWQQMMGSLIRIETSPENCADFYNYHQNKWNPSLIGWTLAGFLVSRWAVVLIEDENYDRLWKNATVSGENYLKGHVPLHQHTNGVMIRHERIQHVFHMHALFRSTGLTAPDFKQIVEFGGGTGDNIATFRELNFEGTHFIIDLPPMLYLQQYFAHFSNWPAYLAEKLPDGDFSPRKTVLESSMNLELFDKHLNQQTLLQTLFIATFSLNESPLEMRKIIFDRVSKYGTLLIAFSKGFDNTLKDDVANMKRVAQDMAKTHSSCIWPIPDHGRNYYFVLAALDLNKKVQCNPTVGCTEKNLVHGENCIISS